MILPPGIFRSTCTRLRAPRLVIPAGHDWAVPRVPALLPVMNPPRRTSGRSGKSGAMLTRFPGRTGPLEIPQPGVHTTPMKIEEAKVPERVRWAGSVVERYARFRICRGRRLCSGAAAFIAPRCEHEKSPKPALLPAEEHEHPREFPRVCWWPSGIVGVFRPRHGRISRRVVGDRGAPAWILIGSGSSGEVLVKKGYSHFSTTHFLR